MDQKTALKALKNGYSVFLTGPAGSGKTYILNEFIAWLKRKGVAVAVTASTGIAATHLNGTTIHSWSGLGIKDALSKKDLKKIARNGKVVSRLTDAQALVIDEISMLHAHQLDLIDRICRYVRRRDIPFGGLQVVFCGDFFQLPPVSRGADAPARFVFASGTWQSMDIRICYLDEQHRHEDSGLTELLNGIRTDAVAPDALELLYARLDADLTDISEPTRLYTHNIDVDRENAARLATIRAKSFCYTMRTQGERKIVSGLVSGCLAPERLILKEGARVMFVKNNFEAGFVNGTTGTVIGFDDDSRMPVVRTGRGREILAAPETWRVEEGDEVIAAIRQVPLRLAWAVTVHKSQGMTLDAAEIDLARSFEYGMGYVALSRVRAFSGLRLLGLNDVALRVSPEIVEFDRRLQEKSKEFERELASVEDVKEEPEVKTKKKKREMEERTKAYAVEEIRKKYPHAYEPWSEEDDRALIGYKKNGKKIKELAEIFGRKRGAICSRLKKLRE